VVAGRWGRTGGPVELRRQGAGNLGAVSSRKERAGEEIRSREKASSFFV
jgi:hypothetical protein